MSRRKTPDEYRALAAERGFEWLGPEVSSSKHKTWWRCLTCGYEWAIGYTTIQGGNGCKKCGISRRAEKLRYQPERYERLASEHGFEFLGPSVHYTTQPTYWRRDCGHIVFESYNRILQGYGCMICAQERANSGEKRCSKCGKVYPATAKHFPNASARQQFKSWCRTCYNAYRREHFRRRKLDEPDYREVMAERHRRWHQANPDKVAEYRRRFRLRHPHYVYRRDLERQRVTQRRWRERNPDRAREIARAIARRYRERHPDRVKAATLRWRQRNPDKVRAQLEKVRVRRDYQKALGPGVTTADIQRLRKAQRNRCYWCDALLDTTYQLDHVIPLSRGGAHAPSNVVLACKRCNQSKGAKLPHEWKGSGGKLL